MLPSSLPSAVSEGYVEELWEWDIEARSPAAELSPCRQMVYFHIDPVLESQGTAGVRGTKGFSQGEHYWEVEFLEPLYGLSVMLGVGTQKALLHMGSCQYINLLGKDGESWGLSYKGTIWHRGQSRHYTEPFYEKRTVIGVHLSLKEGTLTFYRNRKSLGIAFSGLDEVTLPLYPIACSTAAGTELRLGIRICRLPSLQDTCLHMVSKTLKDKTLVDALPLPPAVCQQLKQLGKQGRLETSH